MGYRGRTALFELLVMREELRNLVLERRSSTEIQAAALTGMQTIRQSGVAKILAGETTVDEVMRVAMSDVR